MYCPVQRLKKERLGKHTSNRKNKIVKEGKDEPQVVFN